MVADCLSRGLRSAQLFTRRRPSRKALDGENAAMAEAARKDSLEQARRRSRMTGASALIGTTDQ